MQIELWELSADCANQGGKLQAATGWMPVNCGSGCCICQTYRFEWMIDWRYPPATFDYRILNAAHITKHTQTQMDIWQSKQLTLELVDLEWVSESSLVFQAVLISFWLPMCFTIYRSQSPLASIPGAILSNPSLLASATLFPHSMLCILLSVRGDKLQREHVFSKYFHLLVFCNQNNVVLRGDSIRNK